MERAMTVLNRASTNPTLINVLLIGCFGALGYRSLVQQREIEALESEKDSLVKANKAIKTTIWNSKQQLFADAHDAPPNSRTTLVPLSKLKAIYGEATTASPSSSTSGDAEKGDGKSPATKFVI